MAWPAQQRSKHEKRLATALQYRATSHCWRVAACCRALSLSLQRTLPGLHANMKSGSLFSCMHCTTVLSFFIGHMQLDKANIVSSLFMALYSLRRCCLLAGRAAPWSLHVHG
jgi:hypothetical protein